MAKYPAPGHNSHGRKAIAKLVIEQGYTLYVAPHANKRFKFYCWCQKAGDPSSWSSPAWPSVELAITMIEAHASKYGGHVTDKFEANTSFGQVRVIAYTPAPQPEAEPPLSNKREGYGVAVHRPFKTLG